MALQANIPQAPLGAITTFRIVSLFETVLASFGAWLRARATEKALLKLSDQQLTDVGLHRGEILELAEDLAHGSSQPARRSTSVAQSSIRTAGSGT